MKKLWVPLALFIPLVLSERATSAEVRYEVEFPDPPGYQTLVCDFHTHTVYSDGMVWPPVRVNEAWRQGFDATAITDHIEHHLHEDDLPIKLNRSYELAAGRAKELKMLFPMGAEITRDTPPGHFNAIFLRDIEPLDTPDLIEVFKRANEQGAFVFWNHHEWQGEEKGRWLEIHTTLYENKLLHGMEVANGGKYYPRAHQWCLDKNLTMLGNSDTHDPDLIDRTSSDHHRTATLVFVKEKSLDGLKEALRAGRAAVWYTDQLIGRQEWLEALFYGSIKATGPNARSEKSLSLEIANSSDVDMKLKRIGPTGPGDLKLPARGTTLVRINLVRPDQPLDLRYVAVNLLTAPGASLPVVLKIEEK
jgi:hypothetical protein